MAIQDDSTVLCKGDLKAYHESILPYLGGNFMLGTNVSDYYSTDEKIVGVWTDGKPLYQRTYFFTSPTSSAVDVKVVSLDSTIIVHEMKGMIGYYSLNGYQGQNYYLATHLRNDGIYIEQKNIAAGVDCAVTIQYTKTTDTANSAVTTPGCYDINFPNTWPENKEIYFGNGLYGQRFTGSITQSANGFSMLSLESSNISKLINCGGSWFHGSQYICLNGTNDVYQSSGLVLSEGNLSLRTKSNQARTNAAYDIWVTYTK